MSSFLTTRTLSHAVPYSSPPFTSML